MLGFVRACCLQVQLIVILHCLTIQLYLMLGMCRMGDMRFRRKIPWNFCWAFQGPTDGRNASPQPLLCGHAPLIASNQDPCTRQDGRLTDLPG